MANPQEEQRIEKVSECVDLMEAEMVRGLLESRGIDARVVARDQWIGQAAFLGVGNLAHFHVTVPEADIVQAREVLLEVETRAKELDTDSDVLEVCCPACGSTKTTRESISTPFVAGLGLCAVLMLYLLIRSLSVFNALLFVVFLVFAAKMLLGPDGWRCGDCGKTWKD